MTGALHPGAIQGNILRGYRSNLGHVRHLMLAVDDAAAARRFLGVAVAGGDADTPAITSNETWEVPHRSCFNIGFTFAGLAAIGTPPASLASFPSDFREGMAARAMRLGDVGDSAPASWPAPFDRPDRIHLVASIHAAGDTAQAAGAILDQVQTQVARAFTVLGARDGAAFPGDKVHFGYVDSIAQPRFHPRDGTDEPLDPLGTVLLGHPTLLEGLMFRVPEPAALGLNGTFNAFRVLAQDVAGFERYLDQAAREIIARLPGDQLHGLLAADDETRIAGLLAPPEVRDAVRDDRFLALRELVAAQMCGRWRNGAPLATCPDVPDPDAPRTGFDYGGASPCPAGAHIRRVNPRGGAMVQRIAHHTRRLVRRGFPYGPPFDPANPDGIERGLLGNFLGANIGAQFEAIMCDWLNLGLQDPEITGANDPMTGANMPETSWFDLRLKNGTSLRLRGFPRFVVTRGGAYTFLPSMDGVRYLAALNA